MNAQNAPPLEVQSASLMHCSVVVVVDVVEIDVVELDVVDVTLVLRRRRFSG